MHTDQTFGWIIIAVAVVLTVALFLLLRAVVLWYFKLDKIEAHLAVISRMTAHLAVISRMTELLASQAGPKPK